MSDDDEKLDFPNADIILRTPAPPARDFRAHKLILSLISHFIRSQGHVFPSPPNPRQLQDIDCAGSRNLRGRRPPDALDIIL